MKKSGISKYIKFIILSLMCVFGIVIIGTNSKAKAADYSNADSGHFYLHADGSISAEFTVSGNDLNMRGWLLCLFASEPAYNSTDHKLDNSNDLHPYSVDNCVNYFFTSSTQKIDKFFVTWSADSNDQKTNWSADGTTKSEKTLADYSLSDTEYYIVIGPRHYNSGWAGDEIGGGTDGYWENCDLYVGKLSEVSKDYVLSTKQLIADIGTVEYTTDSKLKIKLARTSYDALNSEQKALVTNYKTLTDAEAAYKGFDDNAKANATKELIAAIGDVAFTEESKGKIDQARSSYNSLTEDQKALVTNYETLTDAEAAYKGFDDNAKANETIALIEAIGEVEYTDECYYAIDDARSSYDSLTEDQKTLVTNYETLTTAEALYLKLEEDIEKSDATMELINNIGEVEYTPECKALIDQARTSYDALTDDQKALVTNYEILENAEAAYKGFDDPAKANATKELINAIGDVSFTEESKSKIDQARASYDALTADQKKLITDDELKVLTDAEKLYQLLKDDNDKASEVIALINAIGDVAYTEECNNAINRAFEAYDSLTLDQKELVTNYEDLEAKAAAYIILDDNAKANATKELIVAIGEVAYTEESKDKIDLARLAYDSLTDNQKTLVTEEKLKVLTDAEALYLKLKNDNAKANTTTTLITSIGNVEYNDTCKGKINSARASYNALTADQKALVNNLKTLETAEAKYAKLENVVVKIESIKAVSYNSDSKALIDDARKVYNELTEEEKALIPNYSKLDESEKTYTTLENNHKTFVGWMITLGIILAIILLLCIEYLLFFFVFNKWVKDGDKLIRVFKVGSKDDKVTLLKMNLHIIHKNEDEIFKSKNDIQ